jgi:predicted amidophosphoribosyltransferase
VFISVLILAGIGAGIGLLESRLKNWPKIATLPRTGTASKVAPEGTSEEGTSEVKLITQAPDDKSEATSCPSCSKPLRSGDRFCSQCGYRFFTHCPSCSKPLRLGDRFCSQCGYRLSQETPSNLLTVKASTEYMCSSCKAPLQPHDQFCGTCGTHVMTNSDATQWRGQ